MLHAPPKNHQHKNKVLQSYKNKKMASLKPGRQLADNNYGNFQAKYGFLANYQQAPVGCSNHGVMYGQATNTSVMIYHLYNQKDSSDVGEYMIKLTDFAKMTYEMTMEEEYENNNNNNNNGGDGDDWAGDENAAEDNGDAADAQDEDGANDGAEEQDAGAEENADGNNEADNENENADADAAEGGGERKLEDSVNPYDYLGCDLFPYVDEDNVEYYYYVGPTCSTAGVTLGLFTDYECTIPLDTATSGEEISFSSITGFQLPSGGLISLDSVNCVTYPDACYESYSRSLRKCETDMAEVSEYYGRDESGCDDVSATVGISVSRMRGASGAWYWFGGGVAVLMAAILAGFFLGGARRAKKNNEAMTSESSNVTDKPLV